MPTLHTVGADDIIKVWRDITSHTVKGEPCAGAPYEKLYVMFHGARTLEVSISKKALDRDGVPTCVAGLVMLRDELTKIIDEYTGSCPTCKRRG